MTKASATACMCSAHVKFTHTHASIAHYCSLKFTADCYFGCKNLLLQCVLYSYGKISIYQVSTKFPTNADAIFSLPSSDDVTFKSITIQMFTLEYIENATHKYKTLIGEGGFGSVYRGTLSDGQEVAVKVRSSTSTQGTREFENEVRITKHLHCNLVYYMRSLNSLFKCQNEIFCYEKSYHFPFHSCDCMPPPPEICVLVQQL